MVFGLCPARQRDCNPPEHGVVLSRQFFIPVCQMQVLLDLAAFIPVFEGLPGLMIRFAERMLRITDRVADDLDCFCHSTFHVGNLSGFAPANERSLQRSLFWTLSKRPGLFRN